MDIDFEEEFKKNMALMSEDNSLEEDERLMIDFMKKTEKEKKEDLYVRPEPTQYKISTISGMCSIINKNKMERKKLENANKQQTTNDTTNNNTIVNEETGVKKIVKKTDNHLNLHMGKLIYYMAENIIRDRLNKTNNFPIQGLDVDNLKIRFDETYYKKRKTNIPLIKYGKDFVNIEDSESCNRMLEELKSMEDGVLNKQGRQKKKKDNYHFYNSCSFEIKPNNDMKCITIRLFNNGKITITGSIDMDGNDAKSACNILLDVLKRNKDIFIGDTEEDINGYKIENFDITMINSDFETNFKIDLNKLLSRVQSDNSDIYTKYNPQKYRGLIFGYYWNRMNRSGDGLCHCEKRCKGKGNGERLGECKKVTIPIFKSGKIIITGGRRREQLDGAYRFINNILDIHFKEVLMISLAEDIEETKIKNKEEEIERRVEEIDELLRNGIEEDDMEEKEDNEKEEMIKKESDDIFSLNIQKILMEEEEKNNNINKTNKKKIIKGLNIIKRINNITDIDISTNNEINQKETNNNTKVKPRVIKNIKVIKNI